MTNKNEIAAISTSKFLSLIPPDEFSVLANEGMMLYSTNKSIHFNPLVLWKREDKIMVALQEFIQEDKRNTLFSDEDVTLDATYSFPEADLMALIGDEPELLPDIIAFLEENKEVEGTVLMDLLTYLNNEGFSVINTLTTLASLSRDELERLLFIFNEMRTFLRQYFTNLFCSQNSTDQED